MFENIREMLQDLASGAVPSTERAGMLAKMRDTLVAARVALADLADGLEKSRVRLAAEQRELGTVRRRLTMAEQINDAETVEVARRYEEKHAERVAVLERKIAVQEEELVLAEQEVASMTSELRAISAGVGSGLKENEVERELNEVLDDGRELRRDIDSMARKRAREERESDAEARLAELKRRMQK